MAVETPAARGRVEILDLLRAIAVLAVLMFHYSFRGAAADGLSDIALPALAPCAKYGFLGVQLFFVISGFVIAYSTEQRTAVEFCIARIARIYPGFIICMTLTFVLTLAGGAPRFQVTFAQWLANFAIIAPALKQPFMDGAYWSLVYEVIFYAWIAGLLSLGWYRRHVDVIVIVWMALSVFNQEYQSPVLQRVFLTDESGFFAAGLMIYEMYRGRRDAVVALLMALATVTAIGQSLHLTDWNRGHFHIAYDNWVVAGLALGAVAVVALAIRLPRLPVPSYIAAGIGGITYPLYLLHQNIGYIVFNHLNGALPPALIVSMTAVGAVLLSWMVWRFVERRGQRLLKSALARVVTMAARPANAVHAP